MEHSNAIMEDAGKATDNAQSSRAATGSNRTRVASNSEYDQDRKQNNFDRRKRKGDFPDSSMRHGSRGGRDGTRGDNKRHKKGDMGRGEYLYVHIHEIYIIATTGH